MILLVLSLLIGTLSSPLFPVEAATLPVDFGATWEYREFTQAFSRYLHSTNPVLGYLFAAMGVGLIFLLILELIRRSREPKVEPEPTSSDASDSETVQRRAWARIESSLDCRFVITRFDDSPATSLEDTASSSKTAEIKGLIVDLSGGGCKIATSYQLQVGDELELYLELEPRRRFALKAEVVRIDTDEDNDQILAGIKFKDIREAVRDQIISWLFKHQQSILEGQRRLAEGLCLGCGKPLTEAMREQTIFCAKCNRIQKSGYRRQDLLVRRDVN